MISEHASPLAELGGVDASRQNQHVACLAAAVAGLGHEIRVYTRQTSRDLPRRVEAGPGVTVVHVPAGPPAPIGKDQLLPYIPPFGRWLAGSWQDSDWTPDVVHAHFWMSGLAALVAQATVPRPIVQTFHALGTVKRRHEREQDTSPANRMILERVVGQQVDRVIAQSSDELSELLRLGVPRHRVTLASSGVDSEIFTPTGPAVPRPPDRLRILTVGRLVERKGFADLIRALPRIPGAELMIVGGPPQPRLAQDPTARRLLELAARARVADRVRLVGAVPLRDMPRWYRSADVLACTPWYEPFGLAALEGMACGCPVVATAVGGLTDMVVDQVTGDLVPPRDPEAIGDAVRRLLADPTRRLGYATAGADRARQRYPWSRTADQVTAVYQAVCQRPGAPASSLSVAGERPGR
jgi:glycosyltransferase involved in cell wall biosynthesis